MARNCSARRSILFCIACFHARRAHAIPAVAFPLNSQVPTVARVGEQYSFQFSSSTFIPEDSNFTYSLSAQPAWLAVDSTTRTLSGAPSSADVGSTTFTLTAANTEGATHMSCTLVVSSSPPPQLEGDIGEQLATTANLSSTRPPVVTLLPSTAFAFQFEHSSFIDIVQRELYYYATLVDHTPLPAWLLFDPTTLSFAGVAPQLSAFPQSWNINLIASDVEGFAGAAASFEVAIGLQQLVFVPEEQVVSISAGADIEIRRLIDTLFLNGAKVPTDAISKAQAAVPSWLDFDPETMVISGSAPSNVSDMNITVSVIDAFGNEAAAVVSLRIDTGDGASLFASKVGSLTARAGTDFNYHFTDDLFASEDLDLLILLPANAKWLSFDAETRSLNGKVPIQTESPTIEATVTARSRASGESQRQSFVIMIEPVVQTAASTIAAVSSTSATSSASATPDLATAEREHARRYTPGAVAGIVLGTVAALAIVGICLFVCCQRRRRKGRNGYLETEGVSGRNISRPILPPDPDAILVTKEIETDVEKGGSHEIPGPVQKVDEPAPQIALDISTQLTSTRMKWSKRFSRISQVSSIGDGEDAIRADSNIPEWGRDSKAFHTPHDIFSVPAEMARSSRQLSADLSPSKRALKRLRQHRQSQQSIGLGIYTGGAIIMPRHSSRGARGHRGARSSAGVSTIMDGSSLASVSTRGTSVLSTRASDFPRPGTRSTFGSRSIPAFAGSEKRKSIRLVDRSDSVADDRSMHEKRQSFIRNRASTSFVSPLFAHGSRAASNPLQNGGSSRDASLAGSQRRSKRGRSQRTTYSASSSLEPQTVGPRRFSQRVRSAFAPSFPRAITRSSLGADDEGAGTREGSSSGFETISSSNSEAEWRTEMALPRQERSWVLPNEASPTPPPVPTTWRQPSSARKTTPSGRVSEARQKWKDRFREHSSSPLSTAVTVPIADGKSNGASGHARQHERNRLSEPISLVSSDSLNKGKLERPRLVQTSSKRPVSVEKMQRLSSLRVETEDTRPGSEVWEAMESAGLMPPNSRDGKDGTRRSNMSGPAFI